MSASASLSLCPTCYGSPAFACTPPMQYSFTFPKIEGTTLWEIFLGTPPSWHSGTGSEKGVDLNSPLRVIAKWQLMHSFCALHHARMQMVISPQSLGCTPLLSCSSLTKLRLTSPLLLGYPSGAGRRVDSTLRHTTTLCCCLKSPLEDL